MENILHDQGFLTHLTIYAAVNILLFVINMATSSGSYWFIWPLLGWGLGLIGHAYGLYRVSHQ